MPANGTSKSWQTLLPFLARHRLFAKESLEGHYPFTHDEIRRHSDWLNFSILSTNDAIKWTEDLIEEFADWWNWDDLSYAVLFMREKNLSDAFVARYADRWDEWVVAAMNGTLNEEVVGDEPTAHSDAAIAEMRGEHVVHMSERQSSYFEQSEGRWTAAMVREKHHLLDFSLLSHNYNVRWSVRLLLEYEYKWDWHFLACNPAVWNRVLKAHGGELLEWVSRNELPCETCPEENSAEVNLSGLSPDAKVAVAHLMTTFGEKSRVVGVQGPAPSKTDRL